MRHDFTWTERSTFRQLSNEVRTKIRLTMRISAPGPDGRGYAFCRHADEAAWPLNHPTDHIRWLG
jgi:hypothetical protein